MSKKGPKRPNPSSVRLADGGSLIFTKACEIGNIPPTHRQWMKWKAGRGAARKYMAMAKHELAQEAKDA